MSVDKFVIFNGPHSSLVLEMIVGGAPLWRYWGPRLADVFAAVAPLCDSRPTPSFSLDETVAFSIFPTFGNGWFGQSALLAHRDGEAFAQEFENCTLEWIDAGKSARFVLSDRVAAITITLMIALDGDVLTLSSCLTNTGNTILDVQWLAAACLPLPDHARTVHSFSGKHNGEFLAQSDPLGRAIWHKENRRGLTSHDAFPGARIEADGVVFGAQIAWSGNHKQMVEWLDDGRYQWQLGEWLAPGEIRLAPGAALHSPEILATCSPHGKNGVAQNFHGAVRKKMQWPGGQMKPRPVHLNTWEGYYFNHDLPSLMTLADAAAGVGVERFVLDDGWFHNRDNDTSGLGDWWADKRKYPDGLLPLARHVCALGMEFGLWVEPEMINPDSETFRAHPHWALQIAGRPLKTARNQLVLDLSCAQVSDYLFESIAKLIQELPISYLKWDHNRDLAFAGRADGRASYDGQIRAAYALFGRFRRAFPDVEIEACAGGGGRIDAGIIGYTHRFWTSDCIDAVARARMQPGFLEFMPPEIMGSHIGASPAHSTGRSQSLDFRASVALQGHLGVEFDLVKLGKQDLARLAQWIAFYKDWRHLLHGDVTTGNAADGILWHAAGNRDEWIVILYCIEPMTQRHTAPVRLPFVDRSSCYTIAQIAPGQNAANGIVYDGSWLIGAGMPIPPMMAQSAIIFHGCRQ